jgi:XTP/dITP diphosphohydrolase
MPTIVLATRNPGKVREIRQVFSGMPVRLVSLEDFGPIPECVETGETFAENARHKALYYARATGQWALADDSGLAVDALGGAPGVHSARYAAADSPAGAGRGIIDQANNRRLLVELAAVPAARRTARFICHLALAGPEGVLLEAVGTVEGRVAQAPAGENGFGYDPLFYVEAFGCTTAQLPAETKNLISHRGQALRQLAGRLAEYLAGSQR